MKKNFFKVVALSFASVLAFVGCSKDDGNVPVVPQGEKAILRIGFSDYNPSPGARAFDENNAGTDVNNAYVFVLNAMGGVMDKFYVAQEDVPVVTERPTTTAAKKVYVLGNTGNVASFALVANEAGLKAEIAKLESLAATDVWLQESAAIDFSATTAGGDPLANVDIQLKPIPARIDVKVINSMDNWSTAEGSGLIEIKGVAVLYSAGYSHYIPTFIPSIAAVAGFEPAGEYYRSGISGWASEANSSVYAALDKSWDVSSGDFAETFYALPGGAAFDKNTIVTVYGSYNDEDFYWPAHFSATDLKRVLENGKFYTLTITLGGNALSGGGGTIDPEEEVVGAFITVNITSSGWGSTISLDKPFN